MKLGHLHETDANQVEAVGEIILMADDFALGIADQVYLAPQAVDEILAETGEHGHRAQMIVEGAAAVVVLDLGAQRLVALHDLKNVFEHLEHDAGGGGANGGGPRIAVHAGHLAEQVACVEFVHRVRELKIDRGIYGNRTPAWAGERRRWPARQFAGELTEKSRGSAFRLHVRHGTGKINAGCAFQNVKRSRAVLALAADNLARFVASQYHCVPVEFKERSRDVLKERELLEV